MKTTFILGLISGFVLFFFINGLIVSTSPEQQDWDIRDYDESIVTQKDLIELSLDTCKAIEDSIMKDDCYYDYATVEGSVSICTYVKDESRKDSCIAVAGRDLSKCHELLSLEARDDCYLDYAVVTRNGASCIHIDDSSREDWCYHMIASQLKDITICSAILDSGQKQKCRDHVSSLD